MLMLFAGSLILFNPAAAQIPDEIIQSLKSGNARSEERRVGI